jgi:hypothetical protein
MAWHSGVTTAMVVAGSVFLSAQIHVSIQRVRTLHPILRSAFERGLRDSATMRQLVSRLEESDVIVHLTRGSCPGRRVVGCVVSVSATAGVRYIRIDLVLLQAAERTPLRTEERLAAQIGHELRHAVEIAEEPEIVDAQTLERAYSKKKAYSSSVGFETDAAMEAGARVLEELQRATAVRSASPR